MPVFAYKGVDEAGKAVDGMREADSPKGLRALLRKEGVFLSEVTAEQEKEAGAKAGDVDVKQLISGRISTDDIAIMTRQLATLVGAGIPLVEALSALVDQVDHERLKRVVSAVKQRVNEGSTLADAMGAHPKVFSTLFTNMIRAGEHSGALHVVLIRLADFTEAQARLRSKVFGTMAYPIIMVVIGSAIMGILMTVVVPKVTRMFTDMKMSLPLPTRILIFVSDNARDYWYLLLGGTIVSIWGFFAYIRSPKGRAWWDRTTLKMPVFGKIIRMLAIARFSRTMSTLLKSGVPLLTSMDIVQAIVTNTVLSGVIEQSREAIKEGESIAAPLRRSGEFPPMVYHMVAIGERSGQLEEMLLNVANAYDAQVETRMTALTSLLEPVMIVVMGGVVAFIVMSILLPILQMNTMAAH
ncbi:MAG TPA: type II secretion system inner membrane protein GspF [Myxococcales bacterium]|jgi:general secretion pathway protein F|nr:type II secretion system inner membrane protein GspF [Myxococcales bacterium]